MKTYMRVATAVAVLVAVGMLASEAIGGRFGGGGFRGGGFGGGGFGGGRDFGGGGFGGGREFGGGGFGGGREFGGGGGFGGGREFGGGGFGGGREFGGGGFSGGEFGGGSPFSRPDMQSHVAQSGFGGGGSVNGPFGGDVRPGAGGSGTRNAYETPRGGTVYTGGGSKSFTGPGGNTYSGGAGAWAYTGPRGAVAVGGGKAGSVTGPGGNTIAGGETGHAVIGPNGNVHAGGSQAIGVKGPDGAAVAGRHGAATVGPEGAVAHGSRGGIATGPAGTVAGGQRGAVAVGPHGAVAGGGSFFAGRGVAGAGAIGTRFVTAGDLRGQGDFVRANFTHYNSFTPNWYHDHPGAWFAAGWAAGSVWNAAAWTTCAPYVGYPADVAPIYYNYGDTVTYQDGNVYYGDQVDCTQEQYAQQASQIAAQGAEAKPAEDDKWQALGVFALAVGNETTSDQIFQLALDQNGVVRGNYYNATTDATQPLTGSLNKKSQRVAWTLGDNKNVVCETGLYNLTQEQTTILVHFGKDRTEQYKLFRVKQDQNQAAGQPAESS